MTNDAEPTAILSVHQTDHRKPRQALEALRAALDRHPEAAADETGATRLLEREVAGILGKERALLLPSGKMAQLIAVRVHADRRAGKRVVVAHPRNHLSLHEESNYAVLHALAVRAAGDPNQLLTTADVMAAVAPGDVSTVLWELPNRELGGELPSWPDLTEQVTVARNAGAATHLDGARVWQAAPHYGRPLNEVCAPFDTVYVSLYKNLEAPRGAVLAGDAAFIAAATVWQTRLGGTIDEAWPLALLALDGLPAIQKRMPAYVAHAQAVAEAIVTTTAATVRPDPPQAGMFHLHLPVSAVAANRAHDRVVDEGHPRLGLRFRTGLAPDTCYCELTFGETALAVRPEQAAAAVARLLELAGRR